MASADATYRSMLEAALAPGQEGLTPCSRMAVALLSQTFCRWGCEATTRIPQPSLQKLIFTRIFFSPNVGLLKPIPMDSKVTLDRENVF